ncbi:MAG: exo-alpha-sialidase [Planctomycetes bacterium]|nr:exo-alpha-sialidase [Planctomycetota bacterium]
MAMLVSFALAGLTPALGADPLGPKVGSRVPFRGVQINTDEFGQDIEGDAANEPTLAVSPVDPDVLVVGWRQFPTIESDSRFAGYAYSHDGGFTWTNAGPLDAPPDQPPDAEQSDPVLAVDSDGVFYYWSEVFRPNPPTTHYVYRSQDDGVTWDAPTKVQ